jgi:hypothetical protein
VPDNYTWDDFIQQVKVKLKIVGVREVELAAVRTYMRVASCYCQCIATFDSPDRWQCIDKYCGVRCDLCVAARHAHWQTGQRVTRLEELQDIDELCVTEVRSVQMHVS